MVAACTGEAPALALGDVLEHGKSDDGVKALATVDVVGEITSQDAVGTLKSVRLGHRVDPDAVLQPAQPPEQRAVGAADVEHPVAAAKPTTGGTDPPILK